MMRFSPIFAAALLVTGLGTGCTMIRQPAAMVPQATNDWRSIVTPFDRARLRDWRTSFVAAIAAARAAGHGAEIAREGVLLQPDSAIGGPLPDGRYRCRIIKVGARSEGMLDYIEYPAFDCRIYSENRRHFAKLTGSQRPMGILFPDSAMREVFLGTLVLGDEQRALPYGIDESRDVAGVAERIGPERWRLILAKPNFESQLDVIELIPAQ